MRKVRETVWIGDCLDAQDLDDLKAFDVIISVTGEPQYKCEDADYWFKFRDASHEYEKFEEAALTFLSHYLDDDKIFIHCQAGVSRSTSVATAAIAVAEGKSWSDVLQETRAGHAPVGFEMIESGERFVDENTMRLLKDEEQE